MPSKHAKTIKQVKEDPVESEPEDRYEKMACGMQVYFSNGGTSFSCIGRTELEFNCICCPFYKKKQAK